MHIVAGVQSGSHEAPWKHGLRKPVPNRNEKQRLEATSNKKLLVARGITSNISNKKSYLKNKIMRFSLWKSSYEISRDPGCPVLGFYFVFMSTGCH